MKRNSITYIPKCRFFVCLTLRRDQRDRRGKKLEKENGHPFVHEGEMFKFSDRMIRDNLWICPINVRHQDDAFYSISKTKLPFQRSAIQERRIILWELCSMRWDIRQVRKTYLVVLSRPLSAQRSIVTRNSWLKLCGALTAQRLTSNHKAYQGRQLSVPEIMAG